MLSIACKRGEEVAVEVVVERLQAADLIRIGVAQAIKPHECIKITFAFKYACVTQWK